MATFSERIELLIDAKAGGAITEMRKLSAATETTSKTQTQATGVTGKLERGLDKMGISAGAAGAVMKTALVGGAAAAAYGIARFAMDGVQSMVRLASGVRIVHEAMGGTVAQASRLVAITDDYGISAESAAKSMAFLGRSIGTDKLAAFHVEVAKGKNGNVDMQQTLVNVAEAYKNMEDPAERSRLVLAAFGKSGRDMIPILEQGRQGILDMFAAVPDKQILSARDLQEARDYKLALDNWNDASGELSRTLGAWLIPTLTEVANGAAWASRAIGKMIDLGKQIEQSTGGWNPFDSLIGSAKMFANKINETPWGKIVEGNDGATRATEKLTAAQRATISAMQDQQDAIIALSETVRAQIDAELGLEGANINMEKAVAEATAKISEQGTETLESREALLNAKKSVEDWGQAVLDNAVAAGDATATATQKQVDSLSYVAATLDPGSPLRVWLDQYIDRLRNGVPATVRTQFEIDQIWTRLLDNQPPGTFNVVGAEGAIVNRPTLALIGEAGPEALVPLNRTAGNSPLPTGMGASGGGGSQVIQLVVSGRVLAEVTAAELNRAGGPRLSQNAIA